jgi:predicted acyl esterase
MVDRLRWWWGRSVRAPHSCRLVALAVLLAALVSTSGEAQTLSTFVPAPDGTPLATDVYLPVGAGWGPWSVILQRTPYGKESGTVRDSCLLFTVWGYACVGQDERGRGASGGHYTGYADEGTDGRATLEWIASQWWCDGNIGTFGGSALGMAQYALAPGAPRALKCMVPIVATPDFYHHAAYQGGALRYALTHGWLEGHDALDVFEQLKLHRLWDAWWEGFAVLPRVGTVDVPALHIGGWYDIFLQGTLDAFAEFQRRGGPWAVGRQKIIVGPWTHYGTFQNTAGQLTYPANAGFITDIFPVVRDWFDFWLKGGSPGVARGPDVKVYLMGAAGEAAAPGNVWLELLEWPPPASQVALFLDAGHGLSEAVPPAGEVELVADPHDPVPTAGGQELSAEAGPYDQRAVEARRDVATFTTDPLPSALTVIGRVRCRLWVRPETPDLDLAVRLTDVYPDGRSMLVTDGIQRARMRCGDDRECFLTPGVATEISVDLWSTALVFNARHRIRISVSGSNWPRFEVNLNDGRDLNDPSPDRFARSELLLGQSYPSRLELPVLRPSPFPRRHLTEGSTETSDVGVRTTGQGVVCPPGPDGSGGAVAIREAP